MVHHHFPHWNYPLRELPSFRPVHPQYDWWNISHRVVGLCWFHPVLIMATTWGVNSLFWDKPTSNPLLEVPQNGGTPKSSSLAKFPLQSIYKLGYAYLRNPPFAIHRPPLPASLRLNLRDLCFCSRQLDTELCQLPGQFRLLPNCIWCYTAPLRTDMKLPQKGNFQEKTACLEPFQTRCFGIWGNHLNGTFMEP